MVEDAELLEQGSDTELAPESEEVQADTVLYDQPWLMSLWRPVLIAIMAACLVIALLAFIRRFAPDLPAIYTQLLVGLGTITALIGCSTTTWLAQPSQRSRRNFGYRMAELALILLITRVAIWLGTGTWPPAMAMLTHPLDNLLDGYFLVGVFVILLAWFMATAMTDDLLAMALQPDDIYMTRTFTDRWQDTARPVYTDRAGILRRFVARWVVGGVLLVILAAGSRFAMPENGLFVILRQNIDPTVVAAIIVYFLLGLVLVSQGQIALLRARWALQKTPSTQSVLRNWPFYALLLIVVIGIIAALMPLGGTFRLAQILTAVIQAVYFGLFGIFRFIMALFLLLISLLTGEQQEEVLPPAEQVQPMMPEVPPQPPSEIPPWAGGAVFWLITAILLGYAAYIYFSGKGFDFVWVRRLWQMLRERWAHLFGAYQEWQISRLRSQNASNAADATPGRGGLFSWLRLRNMNPNQRIRYYYLSILQRAERAGIPRQQSETPLRYAPRLAKSIAQDEADHRAVDELTEAFVLVRYAAGRIEPGQTSHFKQIWNQIKRLLRL